MRIPPRYELAERYGMSYPTFMNHISGIEGINLNKKLRKLNHRQFQLIVNDLGELPQKNKKNK